MFVLSQKAHRPTGLATIKRLCHCDTAVPQCLAVILASVMRRGVAGREHPNRKLSSCLYEAKPAATFRPLPPPGEGPRCQSNCYKSSCNTTNHSFAGPTPATVVANGRLLVRRPVFYGRPHGLRRVVRSVHDPGQARWCGQIPVCGGQRPLRMGALAICSSRSTRWARVVDPHR